MKSLLMPHIAIKPLTFPRTRPFLRRAEKEYIRIFEKINSVDIEFGKALFETESGYAELYDKCLFQFNANCDWIEKTLKPKCWGIDRTYFSTTYKSSK